MDTCDTYPTHQPLRLLLDLCEMHTTTERCRKPASLSTRFDDDAQKLFDLDSSISKDEHRRRQKAKLHCIMDDTLADAKERLQVKCDNGDTTAVWRICPVSW